MSEKRYFINVRFPDQMVWYYLEPDNGWGFDQSAAIKFDSLKKAKEKLNNVLTEQQKLESDITIYDTNGYPVYEKIQSEPMNIEIQTMSPQLSIAGEYNNRLQEWVNNASDSLREKLRKNNIQDNQRVAMAAYMEENNFSRGEFTKAWNAWNTKVRGEYKQYPDQAKTAFREVWRIFHPPTFEQLKQSIDQTPAFGGPSKWWNPQPDNPITADFSGNAVGPIPNWGQREPYIMLDLVKPSPVFPGSYPVAVGTDTSAFVSREYGEPLDTLESFKVFKKNAIGWKKSDEFTWWTAWILGYRVFNDNGHLRFWNWQNYNAQMAARIADAWRFKNYYTSGSEKDVLRMLNDGSIKPDFCTGNYTGWLEQYKTNKWFQLAVDTVTKWVWWERNTLQIEKPLRYLYSPAIFWGYSMGAFDASDPKNNVTNIAAFAPMPNNARKSMFLGDEGYSGKVSGFPTRYPYTQWLHKGAQSLDGFQNDPNKQLLFAVHYLIKYPELGNLPKPPFHTSPKDAAYQFYANILNANRYVNAVLRAGMQADSGKSGNIGVSYLPALEPPEDESMLERIGDALERATEKIVEVHLDAFKMLTFGTTDTNEWLKRASIAATVASTVSGMPVTGSAKNWLQKMAVDAVVNEAKKQVQKKIVEETTGEELEEQKEKQEQIQKETEREARDIQEDIQEAQQGAKEATQSVKREKQELTATAGKATVATGIAVLIALLGG